MTDNDTTYQPKTEFGRQLMVLRESRDNNTSQLEEPSDEAKQWVIMQIAQFIHDHKGDGSFRSLVYDYLKMNYEDAYLSGGMTITNCLSHQEYMEWVQCESCEKEEL